MPKFDIFRGRYAESQAIWIQAVEGLDAACKRMQELAVQKPDTYFVFDALNKAMLATVDTSNTFRHAANHEDHGEDQSRATDAA